MHKFNLRELLEFKPEEGVISLKEDRLVLFQATALGHLKYELICSLGKDIAQGILYRFGYRCGIYDAKMITADYGEEIKFIGLGPVIYRWKGNGQVKVIKELRFGPGLSRYHVEGRWENSHEAEHFVKHYGFTEHPVCWISTGYASGFSSIISGQEMVCIEKTCTGMGHKYCSWEMRTKENWGNLAIKDLYDINYKLNFKNLQTMLAEQESAEVNRKMTQLVLEGKGVRGIAETLSEIIKSSVVIFDRALNIMTVCWTEPGSYIQIESLKRYLQEYLAGEVQGGKWRQGLDKKVVTRLSCWMENYEQQTWIVSPVTAGSKSCGYLMVKEENELSELNLFTIEHASTLCALEYMKQQSALEVELRLKGDLLEEIFTGGDLKQEQILTWAMRMGCDLRVPHQVFVIDLLKMGPSIDENSYAEEIFGFVKTGIDELINRLFPGSLVAVRKKRIIVLLGLSGHNEQRNEAAEFTSLTRNWIDKNLVNYAANIVWGRVCSTFDDYRKSYDEGMKAANILRDLERSNENIGFVELGIYSILWESGNKEHLKEYALSILKPLLDYDREHNTNLLGTLKIYLEKNCGLTETAKVIFLHPNTLRYRLKRIKELTGMDLSNDEDRFQAQLSLRLLKTLEVY